MRGEVRVIRCANYTAVCENGSISAITATNNVTLCAARPYSDNAYSTLFFAEAIGGILQTTDHRAAAPASAASVGAILTQNRLPTKLPPVTPRFLASGWASALRAQTPAII